uniref:Uncharacterized protein n=1 Tax=Glossina brevipalpis TaxID=37001 RepID=A0A1A9X1X9_9MUSC
MRGVRQQCRRDSAICSLHMTEIAKGMKATCDVVTPTSVTTTVLNRTFDNLGNLLWQQEAAEFVEKYPQKRRSQLPTSSVSSSLYNKPSETVIHTMKKRSNGGELLTPYQRHQRDMFSGDLGIPEISSHVGSVVHTFETMAMQRQIAERQRIEREREHKTTIV